MQQSHINRRGFNINSTKWRICVIPTERSDEESQEIAIKENPHTRFGMTNT